MASLEELVLRVGLDEEALTSFDEPKPHCAVDSAAIPRHPQVLVGDGKPVDPVVSQRVVLREHDLHGVPAKLELATEPEHDISEASCVRNGSTLAGHHHDKHRPSLS
jgi:hypothetical protein